MGKIAKRQREYSSESINVARLAELIINLNPQQREELELLLDKTALRILKQSDEDIKEGRTVPIDKW